jgi:NAD-dependent deacetylase
MNKRKILIFTGAGVDKESGVDTFRDSEDGIWNNHKVEDVATKSAWKRDRERVLDFYNEMRSKLIKTSPNLAHKIIAELESDFDVTVVTQNVTDLHERAGSTNVIHLHGELFKSRSTFPGSSETYECLVDINIGDKCRRGSQLRPNVVWFDEDLDANDIDRAVKAAQECDICIIVGTSMQVAPANQIPFLTKPNTLIFIIDPLSIDIYIDKQRRPFLVKVEKIASLGMEEVRNDLIEIYK